VAVAHHLDYPENGEDPPWRLRTCHDFLNHVFDDLAADTFLIVLDHDIGRVGALVAMNVDARTWHCVTALGQFCQNPMLLVHYVTTALKHVPQESVKTYKGGVDHVLATERLEFNHWENLQTSIR
jgi:hypothetical protein